MRNLDEHSITQAVLTRHINAPDERLRNLMTNLVQHLHAFARETAITEAEWIAGIRFLTDVGAITDDSRQEFILLSDVLGLSMRVTAQNTRRPRGCTESTVFGPFHVEDSPAFANGADIGNGADGKPCFVRGQVLSLDGSPVAGATIEVWQADSLGMYDVQYADRDEHRARGTLYSDDRGQFHFRSVQPEAYPIPSDGPVGRLLAALGRHPWRPAHLHFMITAPGYERLVTHVFREGDQYLDSDAVFGVRSSLVAQWVEHPAGGAPDGNTIDKPYSTLHFEFVLNPVRAPGEAAHQCRQSPIVGQVYS